MPSRHHRTCESRTRLAVAATSIAAMLASAGLAHAQLAAPASKPAAPKKPAESAPAPAKAPSASPSAPSATPPNAGKPARDGGAPAAAPNDGAGGRVGTPIDEVGTREEIAPESDLKLRTHFTKTRAADSPPLSNMTDRGLEQLGRLLYSKVDLEVEDQPLGKVLRELRRALGLNMVAFTASNGLDGIDPDRIRVLAHSWQPGPEPDGTDRATTDEPVFLFLGRLTEEKGPLVLLDAWQRIEASGVKARLVIAGDGPLAEEVGKRCAALRNARFVGFQTGAAKDELLRGCTAMVVPSIWWEPLGLVLYEAYDHGKPVLAARSGGIVDHVDEGLTGWLHRPGDVAGLAAQIREAALDPDECRTRGKRGRQLLLERSAGVWIHDFDAFVGDIVARSSGKTAAQAPVGPASPLRVTAYLADQNPGHDRSFGISRMSQVVLEALHAGGGVRLHTIASETSQHAPPGIGTTRVLPWGTRRKWVRLLTDHLYPLVGGGGEAPDLHYFPKGYLPLFSGFCRPCVVTIHDTIIQYDEDRYPEWRSAGEYAYWAWMLKHTLREADLILTVSEASKAQIHTFMDRHGIARKEIIVTFEPCIYESLPQPVDPPKENYVIHLASAEPHKRSAHLIRWWHEAEAAGRDLPMLHLIGSLPREVEGLLASSRSIVKRPFLEDGALQAAYREARALILPSEIEGFGLPALEAYYLGTPVCFVAGTSVAEVLGVATRKGAFSLKDPDSLVAALEEVVAMSPAEVRDCGLKLRETYAASKVAARMLDAFRGVTKGGRSVTSNPEAVP